MEDGYAETIKNDETATIIKLVSAEQGAVPSCQRTLHEIMGARGLRTKEVYLKARIVWVGGC